MKIKLLVGALALLIAVNLAAIGAFLFVQSRAPRPVVVAPGDSRPEVVHERLMAGLGREERRHLFRTMRAFHEETRGLVEETFELEDELMAAMNESPVPRARIDSLLERISANRLAIARNATDRVIAMGDSLSPEQRERMMGAIMRMRGAGGPPGDGPRGEGRRWRRHPQR